jgi:hypothetical protein
LPFCLFAQDGFRVTLVIGTAEYFKDADAEEGWKPVEYEMNLQPDTRIRTGENSRIEMARGEDRFKVGQKSVLKLQSLGSETTPTVIQLLAGKMLSMIDATKGPKKINILTPAAVLGVRGTSFLAASDGRSTSVFVFEGDVEISSPENKFTPVLTRANQSITVTKTGKVTEIQKIPFQVYQEWGMEVPTEVFEQPPKEEKPNLVAETATDRPAVETAPKEPPIPLQNEIMLQNSTPTQNVPFSSPDKATEVVTPQTPKEPIKPRFGMNANVGPSSLNGKSLYQVTLMPEFGIGNFGIGLYLPAFIDLTKDLFPASEWENDEDWDFDNWQDGTRDFLNKFLYISYGKKRDFLFIKLGNIPDMTLGYGFLMNLFSNMLEFPVQKKMGIQFDLNTKYGGFETVSDDLFQFQIYGGRIFVHPLFWSVSKMAQKVDSGFTYIVDSKPYLHDLKPAIHLWSVDTGAAVVEKGFISMLVYANYGSARLVSGTTNASYKGGAFVAGFKGHLAVLPFRFEYRNLRNGFIPEYFDGSYINSRQSKFLALLPGFAQENFYPAYNGLLFETGAEFGASASFRIEFQANLNMENDNRLRLNGNVGKGLIPKVYGSFSFDKLNIVSFKDLYSNFLDYRTVITAEGVYQADPKVDIAFIWKRTYILKNNVWEPFTSINVETRFSFF